MHRSLPWRVEGAHAVGWGFHRAGPDGIEASVVTVGTFDGVHAGHVVLVDETVRRARGRGVASVVVTWDRHPALTVRPERAPLRVSSPERSAQLLLGRGVDRVLVVRFDDAFARWSPEAFVRRLLVATLGASEVCVGADWRFGHRGAGDVAGLRREGARHGFAVTAIQRRCFAGVPGSSTAVRRAIAEGDLPLARALLGRAPELETALVAHDGRALLLRVRAGAACPPDGVYHGRGAGRLSAWAGPAALSGGELRLRSDAFPPPEDLPIGALLRLQLAG